MCERIQSYLILDLETTGIVGNIKITELSLIGVLVKHFNDSTPDRTPRVVNKLTVCFHPEKFISNSTGKITGLSNDLLEEQGIFDKNFCDILHGFIRRVPQPACFLAHNGNRFDFPLIQAHVKILGRPFPDDVLCADTLLAFRELKVVERDPPWQIPREVTHPYHHPSFEEQESLWDLKYEDDLSSETIIKAMKDVEKSLYDDCKGLTNEESLSKIYTSTPKRRFSEGPPPSPPRIKRHSLPQGPEMFHPRNNAVRKALFSGSNNNKNAYSYSLSSVYKHLFKSDVPNAHNAEGDTTALLRIISALGSPFHEWVQANHQKINSIRKFW